MSEWLSMDGYGAFVWSAYGLTALVSAVLIGTSIHQHLKAKAELNDLQAEWDDA